MAYQNVSDNANIVGAFRAYISPIVAILGLIGCFFIIVVFAFEKPRSRFSIYAIALAVANAVTLITNTLIDDFMGRGLYYATKKHHFYKLDSTSQFWCKSVEYLSNVMYLISSYVIVAFSLDRFLTIHQPITFYSVYHKRWAMVTCIMVYLTGFILNTPLLIVQGLMDDSSSRTNFTCRMIEDHPVAKFSIAFEVICTFTIPFILVLILNILICVQLWRIKRNRTCLLPKNSFRNRLEMSRVAGHLALTTSFLLLYMPMVCFVLIRLHLTLIHMDRHSSYALKIIDMSRLFSSVKDITYAVNFFLYLTFLANFRRRFVQMFCPKFVRHNIDSAQMFGRKKSIKPKDLSLIKKTKEPYVPNRNEPLITVQ